jgi:hypothetical protein
MKKPIYHILIIMQACVMVAWAVMTIMNLT